MPHFDQVPIIDVQKENFTLLWPTLILAIKSASFIAIDTELSGLGNRRALHAKSVEERFKAISEAAKSRSIISLGLSCFKLTSRNESTSKIWQYVVQTFNITTLCSEDYIVEPLALQFLVDHGFDFNKQYSHGVPYYKGNDKIDDSSEPNLRHLFAEILLSGRTLVFHNALVDLVFLYQCWYATLPPMLATFLADINEAFPGGIYDTKYVAEYVAHSSASYLEYIFRKLQRENVNKASLRQSYVGISFLDYDLKFPFIDYRQLGIDTTGIRTVSASQICMTYANHGWCPNGPSCSLSHNVDCILDMEAMPSKKRRWMLSRSCSNDETPNKRRNSTESLKSASTSIITDDNLEAWKLANGSSLLMKGLSFLKASLSSDSVNENGYMLDRSVVDDQEAAMGRRKLIKESSPEDGCEEKNFLLEIAPKHVIDTDEQMESAITVSLSETMMGIESFRKRALGQENAVHIEGNVGDSAENLLDKCRKHSSELDARLSRKSSGHRAGCDAFMTGFTMATFLANYGNHPEEPYLFSPVHTKTEEMANRIYLSGKDVPLIIQKSTFTKTSKSHQEKLLKLQLYCRKS